MRPPGARGHRDVSLQEKAKEFGHSTAGDAATIASLAGVKTLYPEPFQRQVRGHRPAGRGGRDIFPKTYASEDLMVRAGQYDGIVSSKKLQDVRAGDDAHDQPLPRDEHRVGC